MGETNAPRGITIEQAAATLGYSRETVRIMIKNKELVAWKPRGHRGRKYLIDEVSLASVQAAQIQGARKKAEKIQESLKQGAFAF